MLSIVQQKIRVEAKIEACMEFKYKWSNDATYVRLIHCIFNDHNTKVLELNFKTENRNKLIDCFVKYFTTYLGFKSCGPLNFSKLTVFDYSNLSQLIHLDIIKWFVIDFMNININDRIKIIDIINATVADIIDLKEKLIIQYEEDKLLARTSNI